MQLSDFTKEERAEWLDNEITQIVLGELGARLHDTINEGWNHGPHEHDYFKGQIEALKWVIDSIESIKKEE